MDINEAMIVAAVNEERAHKAAARKAEAEAQRSGRRHG